MRTYIIFKAESMSAKGWENRILAHTGAITDILCEYYDSSSRPLPQPGYRPYEFHRVEGFDDNEEGGDTHYRTGDWEVVRVEEYPAATPGSNYDQIAVCYCQYVPKPSSLIPIPQGKISVDSFASEAEYQQYLEQNKQLSLGST
jgi:hypothetical protein